jgi:hypothetical protein
MLDSPSSISDLSVKSINYIFSDMVYVLRSEDELAELKRRLIHEIVGLENEVNKFQDFFSNATVDKKISMINWTLDIMESNPNITIQELADLIDYRIEGAERELDNAENRDELDCLFNELRILEWIRSTVRMVGQLLIS